MSAASYRLILLRHGESEWNAKNLFTGWVDVGLSATGEAEARRGGEL
ncbi:MAG: histidine phosphatase family protein, partial [Actinopolymorphaceae bacterium]